MLVLHRTPIFRCQTCSRGLECCYDSAEGRDELFGGAKVDYMHPEMD